MFERLWRRLTAATTSSGQKQRKLCFTGNLDADVRLIKREIIAHDDLIVRPISLPKPGGVRAAVVYVDSLNDKEVIGSEIIGPLLDSATKLTSPTLTPDQRLVTVGESVIRVGNLTYCEEVEIALSGIVEGDCCILVHGAHKALLIATSAPPTRGIQEPNTEVVVRGSREGFTEALKVNISLIRRRLRDKALTFETLTVGERSKTPVALVYLRDLTAESLVSEVRDRIKRISIDGVLESGYIEQYIEDNHLTVFSLTGNTERPDVVAAKLLEGRVAIIVDGTPTVLTVPMLFVEGLQAAEDYYSRPYYASLVRFLRFIAFVISILGPAMYVALVSYHHELIPTSLLVTLAAAAEGTPFPAWLEVLLMGLTFEIVREASVRLPRSVGLAVSIVGTLVIGQAAIQAGLFGAPVIIVISLTALTTFINTPHTDAGTVLRTMFIIAAALGGAYGMLILGLFLVVHLAGLRSFGVPYFAPFAPMDVSSQKDALIRAPLWTMGLRPELIPAADPARLEVRKDSEKPKR